MLELRLMKPMRSGPIACRLDLTYKWAHFRNSTNLETDILLEQKKFTLIIIIL
jgi:hypothetical protein